MPRTSVIPYIIDTGISSSKGGSLRAWYSYSGREALVEFEKFAESNSVPTEKLLFITSIVFMFNATKPPIQYAN